MPRAAAEHPESGAALNGAADGELPGLLKAASAGDEGAWRRIIDLYARRVYALARSRLGGGNEGAGQERRRGGGSDAAEEVTQSVFVTVAAKLTGGEYTEQGRFESWLFRVAMNRVRDEARRVRRQALPTDPEVLAAACAQEPEVREDRQPELRALREALGHLTDADREIIELRHHAGMSFKQIAEMLDEPLGTLLARHHRALRKLKERMTEDSRVGQAGKQT